MWQYLLELEEGKYESIEDRTLLQWEKGQAQTSAKNKTPLKNYSHTSEDMTKPMYSLEKCTLIIIIIIMLRQNYY